jgi:hypothetical protein
MKRNGYKLRKEKTKNVLKTKDGKICPCCETQQKRYYNNTVCSTCRSFRVRYEQKTKLKKQLGGKCVKCGNDDIRILHFHHIDKETKLFNLAGAYHSINYKAIEDEAKKCELLCPNCHAKEHVKENQKVIDYYNLNKGIKNFWYYLNE